MDQSADLNDEKLLGAARNLIAEVTNHIDINANIELWNGERIPLGSNVTGPLAIRIASPGVITSIVRRPTLDSIIQHYVQGQLDLLGGTLLDLGEAGAGHASRGSLKKIDKLKVLKLLGPFMLRKADKPQHARNFAGNAKGQTRRIEENKDFIQFHYDVGNEFYALFLD